MRDINGNHIVSCCMTDDTDKYGPCATCMYYRDWSNTSFLKEDDDPFCSDTTVATE